MKSILCAIYGPIYKLAKKIGGKDFECNYCKATSAFLLQTSFKGQHSPISCFFTCYYLKLASKIGNISKFTKELGIFTNWTADGTQYTFQKNWL
jgi:hypothetical protein